MPLNFSGTVMVEQAVARDDKDLNSPKFSAVVLAESSAGVSVPFTVSVWVDMDNNMFPPVENQLFHLDGKLSSGTDGALQIEALRFYPLHDVKKVYSPFITGTGLYLGRPEDGLFNLKSPTYVSGCASFILIDCFHSAKQYQNVARTIQKNQEIYLSGYLHDTEGDDKLILKGSQFSYLSKAQKMVNSTSALLNAVKTSAEGTKSLMSPRKRKMSSEKDLEMKSPTPVAATKTKRARVKVVKDVPTDQGDSNLNLGVDGN